MKWFAIFLILVLGGCASKDPVETVVDNHIDHITDVLNHSYNNFEQTTEIKFLESELEACIVALDDVRQLHNQQISTLETEVEYWKLMVCLMCVILGVLIVLRVKKAI